MARDVPQKVVGGIVMGLVAVLAVLPPIASKLGFRADAYMIPWTLTLFAAATLAALYLIGYRNRSKAFSASAWVALLILAALITLGLLMRGA
jgi:hypothetical protein